MNKCIRISFILLSVFFVVSCFRDAIVDRTIKSIVGKELIIPDSLYCLKDSNFYLSRVDISKPTIITWFDTVGCMSCKLYDIFLMEDINNYCRDTLNEFVSFYVIISPKLQDLDDALYFLWKKNFRIKVFVDRDNAFSEFNNFIPYGEKYHSFLINQDKKIILVGPPNYNKSMWNLYKTTINELQRDARPFVKNY